jgi:hypothetical protein
MTCWRVTLPVRDIVFVKGVFEASDGIGSVLAPPRAPHAAASGVLTVVAPESRAPEVARVLEDLRAEIGGGMCVERL